MSVVRTLSVYHRDSDYAIGAWGNVFMLAYYKECKMSIIEKARVVLRKLSELYPHEGLCSAITVGDHASNAERQFKVALAEVMKEFGSQVRLSAVVFEGSGFRSVIARSVAASLNVLSKFPFDNKYFNDRRQACTWLASEMKKKHNWEIDPMSLFISLEQFINGTKPYCQ